MSGSISLSDLLAVEEQVYGSKPHGLRRLDARLKLALCAALVMANVLLARIGFSAGLLLLCWAGLAASRVALRQALWFVLAPAWATTLVVFGFSIGFGHSVLGQWGPLTFYEEGLWQGVAAGLRVLSEMACAACLVLTTPFNQILSALRTFKVPAILVDTLGFMYRYFFMLWDETSAMRDAARVRGGFSGWARGMRTSGAILGAIFLRAYDRSQRISQAMRARGGE